MLLALAALLVVVIPVLTSVGYRLFCRSCDFHHPPVGGADVEERASERQGLDGVASLGTPLANGSTYET